MLTGKICKWTVTILLTINIFLIRMSDILLLPKQADYKFKDKRDFGGKCLRFWSRGFVCWTKNVNVSGHIPVRD